MKFSYKVVILSILTILSIMQFSYSQDSEKVDSVFSSYFDFLNSKKITASDSSNWELISEGIVKQQVVYDFFENISGIFLRREYRKEHEYPNNGEKAYCYSTNNGYTKICVIFTLNDLEKWMRWYKDNKMRLCWIKDNLVFSQENSSGIITKDYKALYPIFIRFKDRLDWIPVSVKPKYIEDLEKKMKMEGFLEPKKS